VRHLAGGEHRAQLGAALALVDRQAGLVEQLLGDGGEGDLCLGAALDWAWISLRAFGSAVSGSSSATRLPPCAPPRGRG
jgi:hypothetical protein